jgi:hypothetical protein
MQKTPSKELQESVIESPPRDETVGFDLRTQIFDAKTGHLIKSQPYLRHSSRDRGIVYERGGKFFYENGEEATSWAPVVEAKQVQNPQAPQKR